MKPYEKEIHEKLRKELQNDFLDLSEKDIGILKSSIRKSINNKINRSKCKICGETTKKANSHNIPQSSLRVLASDGKVLSLSNAIVDSSYFIHKVDPGLLQAQTFNTICLKCENERFSEYENDAIKESVPYNQHQLNQVELKILLFMSYNKEYTFHYFDMVSENIKTRISNIEKANYLATDIKQINLDFLGEELGQV